jgi:DNA-binding LacI/PurR family transcriptional regulator
MSLRALARELGVSPTAISLALQNSGRVSAELRRAAQRLAKARGYVPNARLAELMSEVRRSSEPTYRGTLGVVSLFPEERPWIARPLWWHLGANVEGARETAERHGYKLELFWLKAPGMTPRRVAQIIEARGVRGLFCLGALDAEEHFPQALRSFAVVTQGVSMPDRMHRVISHFSADARVALDELIARGYRRPGMIIQPHADRRTDFLYTGAFLSHQERFFPDAPIPILRTETWDTRLVATWLERHSPDVLIMHQDPQFVAELDTFLQQRSLKVPRDLGYLVLDRIADRARISGVCQNPRLTGTIAVEMLISRLYLQDFGQPAVPKVELVPGTWNEGRTLRPRL